jgi:hypothetical protein
VCDTICANPSHYKSNEFGVCTLISTCLNRLYNESSRLPCGTEDCYGTENTNSCSLKCENTAHYVQNEERKTCDLKYVFNYFVIDL